MHVLLIILKILSYFEKLFVRNKFRSDQIGYEEYVNIPKSIGKNMTHSNNLISKRYREASHGGQLG